MDDDLHEGFVQNLIEDVNELRKALEKADDEAESYYRFGKVLEFCLSFNISFFKAYLLNQYILGEEFPALSDEEDEQPLVRRRVKNYYSSLVVYPFDLYS